MHKPFSKHIILSLVAILFRIDTSFMPARPRSFSALPCTVSYLSDNPHLIPKDVLQKINAGAWSSLPIAKIPLRKQAPHATPSSHNMPCIEPCQVVADTHTIPKLDCVELPRRHPSSSSQALAVLQDYCLTMPCSGDLSRSFLTSVVPAILSCPRGPHSNGPLVGCADCMVMHLTSLAGALCAYQSLFVDGHYDQNTEGDLVGVFSPKPWYCLRQEHADIIKAIVSQKFKVTAEQLAHLDYAKISSHKQVVCVFYFKSKKRVKLFSDIVETIANIIFKELEYFESCSVYGVGADAFSDDTATPVLNWLLDICKGLKDKFLAQRGVATKEKPVSPSSPSAQAVPENV